MSLLSWSSRNFEQLASFVGHGQPSAGGGVSITENGRGGGKKKKGKRKTVKTFTMIFSQDASFFHSENFVSCEGLLERRLEIGTASSQDVAQNNKVKNSNTQKSKR